MVLGRVRLRISDRMPAASAKLLAPRGMRDAAAAARPIAAATSFQALAAAALSAAKDFAASPSPPSPDLRVANRSIKFGELIGNFADYSCKIAL